MPDRVLGDGYPTLFRVTVTELLIILPLLRERDQPLYQGGKLALVRGRSRSPLVVELQKTLDLAFGRCIGAAGRPLALAVLPNRLMVQVADPLNLQIAVFGNRGEEPAP